MDACLNAFFFFETPCNRMNACMYTCVVGYYMSFTGMGICKLSVLDVTVFAEKSVRTDLRRLQARSSFFKHCNQLAIDRIQGDLLA